MAAWPSGILNVVAAGPAMGAGLWGLAWGRFDPDVELVPVVLRAVVVSSAVWVPVVTIPDPSLLCFVPLYAVTTIGAGAIGLAIGQQL